MLQDKRPANPKLENAVSIGVLLLLLVILPTGIGYMSSSVFGSPAWSSALLGLGASLVIFLSLIVLLGATVLFPDHLPEYENDAEV